MKRKLHLVKTSGSVTSDREKNWPTGDWRISSNNPRNKGRMRFGFTSLLVSPYCEVFNVAFQMNNNNCSKGCLAFLALRLFRAASAPIIVCTIVINFYFLYIMGEIKCCCCCCCHLPWIVRRALNAISDRNKTET